MTALAGAVSWLLLFTPPASRAADTNANPGSSPDLPRPAGLFVHDPSTIVKHGLEYWFFSTGNGIVSRHSSDLRHWQAGPTVFTNIPDWTTNVARGFRGHFWAPDLMFFKDRYLLYYSVSRFGTNTSAIGLATNPTLDPADPRYRWTDDGMVIQTRGGDPFNAIDPAVTLDTSGNLWLVFGSFWSGIKLIQLDPATGKRFAPDSPVYSLAYHDMIEAACVYPHGGFYYLFVNWGQCCRGVKSTYHIRVGRSPLITGPYLDKDGVDMLHDGGSLFLDTRDQYIGPGHAGIYSEAGTHWFSYHYYDGSRQGAPTLGVGQLQWAKDGWPRFVPAE